MYRPRPSQAPAPRRGIILLVVLSMLVLFAVVGLSFVFYADSEATSSRIFREAGSASIQAPPDFDSEQAAAFFMAQLLYDGDDTNGIFSAMRGYSLARSMYGYNSAGGNDMAFTGTGRLHETGIYLDLTNGTLTTVNRGAARSAPIDNYNLINYMCFLDERGNLADRVVTPAGQVGILHDPEWSAGTIPGWRTSLTARTTVWTGGFNVPYTYPDLNNLFLGAVKADGTLLVPSFHRPWAFGALAQTGPPPPFPNAPWPPLNLNVNWVSSLGKYMILRPRPLDHLTQYQVQGTPGLPWPLPTWERMTQNQQRIVLKLIYDLQNQNRPDLIQKFPNVPNQNQLFPYTDDAVGDVKNMVGAPGGNDSLWMDLGAPVITLPDGRKVKMMFAPLIVDLDGRVNLNVHGNIRNPTDPITRQVGHLSNQGWGPWEVNLSKVLGQGIVAPQGNTPGQAEWTQLFAGRRLANNSVLWGRYGSDQQPSSRGGSASSGRLPHFYGQVDFDALGTFNPANGGNRITLPSAAGAFFPTFPPNPRYDNGTVAALTNHPLLYDYNSGPFSFAPNNNYAQLNDDRSFSIANMAALLRYGDTGTEFLTNELLMLCPQNFTGGSSSAAARIRRMVTTHSFDRNVPGLTPWIYNQGTANQYPATAYNGLQAPIGSSIAFPSLTWRNASAWTNLATSPRGFYPPIFNPPTPPYNPTQLQEILAQRPSEFRDDPTGGNKGDWRGGVANWVFQPNLKLPNTPNTWQPATSALGRLDLNRPLTPYPLFPQNSNAETQQTYNARFDNNAAQAQFQQAQADRQQLADDIYRRLLALTGVPVVANPLAPTTAELAPRRWLAQLAVNIVDFMDEDDISTPFNFYTATDAGVPYTAKTFDVGALNTNNGTPDPELPKYWVFGTELPHVVVNEVLAETRNANLTQATNTATVKLWLELLNTFQQQGGTLQPEDGYPVQLIMPANPNSITGSPNAYSPYQLVVVASNAGTGGALLDRSGSSNDSVLGRPNNNVRRTIGTPDFVAGATRVGGGRQPNQGTITNPYIDIGPLGLPNGSPTPFFLLGPTALTAAEKANFNEPFLASNANPVKGTVPPNTPLIRTANLSYTTPFTRNLTTDERTQGLGVILRRLANPHIPADPRPTVSVKGVPTVNPWYNPYVTIDYVDKVPLRDKVNGFLGAYASRVKRQPYGALTILQNNPQPVRPAVYQVGGTSPVTDETKVDNATSVQHTFGNYNQPAPLNGNAEWLVHLDRQLVSPIELLHVSGRKPYELTQLFITGDDRQTANKFGHYVPWFDKSFSAPWQDSTLTGTQSHRLYRLFEFLYTNDRASGVSRWPGARIPGKININTIWDPEIFQAICDAYVAQGASAAAQQADDAKNNPNYFSPSDVATLYAQLISSRTPSGTPSGTDKPFRSSATGTMPANDTQYPNMGIENTLFRSTSGSGGQGVFQLSANTQVPATNHPYVQTQLLNKIYNNLTVRSNVFAVWLTVGLFEVTDDRSRPVKLGAEIGHKDNRQIRHRMFAIIDRTNLNIYSTTATAAVSSTGSQTVALKDVTGTAYGTAWSIQVGDILEFDTGANAEQVQVTAVSAQNKTITATFQTTHSANVPVFRRGNPGPNPRFDPHSDPSLVPYFSLID